MNKYFLKSPSSLSSMVPTTVERQSPSSLPSMFLTLALLFLFLFSNNVSAQSTNIYNNKVDIGPIFYSGTDIETNQYKTAIGPFYESRKDTNGNSVVAIHPFYRLSKSEMDDRILLEYLWPIGMHKTYRGQSYWRFILAYGMNFDIDDPGSRYRYSIFPLIYGGRNIDEKPYFAFFPFGGTIYEILGQDKVTFILFPLYFTHQIKDVKTTTYLWPIFSKTTGEDVQRGGVFPFYGYSNKEQLNNWKKKYVLWPFWTHTKYLAPGPEGYAYILFPLFGHAKVDNSKTLMILPPLFRFSKGEYRGATHKEGFCPWPFIRYKYNKEESKFYAWPLWGYRNRKMEDKWFTLWPIVLHKKVYRREYYGKRTLILPFIHNQARYRYAEPGKTKNRKDWGETDEAIARNLKIWPLMNYIRENDSSHFGTLSLWPFRSTGNVERNYGRLWTIYSHDRNGNTKEDTVLWGLFRWRRDNSGNKDLRLFPIYSSNKQTNDNINSKKWNILYGLLGYEREGLQKKLRLLYFFKFKYGKDKTENNITKTLN